MSCSMRWKIGNTRTPKVKRVAAVRHGLEHYCRDLKGWPQSWMGLEKDLPPGEQLIALFRPFLEHLAASNLSPKTIQKHVDNMWARGVHPRSQLRPSSEEKASRASATQDDRIRWTTAV